jgi:asparagine synthase (glutamine-hydrolysing)
LEFAKQIASKLGIDQIVIHLPRASGQDALDILGIKCGTNYLGVSFAIPLINKMKEAYGKKITMVMGDGGDRILRDTTPVKRISSLDGLTEYTLKNNSILSPRIIASITRGDERELISRLRDRLASFEEKKMDLKYVHYIFYERCRKWHFQGEDRNRAIVRHVAPFYASPLFEYSMSLPDRFKKNFRLYREVLTRLSPTVADIPNSEWNFPITSKKLGIYSLARSLYFHLPERLKSIAQRRHHYPKKASVYPADSSTRKCFDSQLKNCPAIGEYLSMDGIRKNLEVMEKMGFDHLFTLVSLMEMVQSGSSSIEQYRESKLI